MENFSPDQKIGTGKDDIEATPSEIPNKKNDDSDDDGSRLIIADEEDNTGKHNLYI